MLMPYLIQGLLLLIVSQDAPVANPPQPSLGDLVHRYMLSDDLSQRTDIVQQIKQDKNFTHQRLSKAIRLVQLWQPMPQRKGRLAWIDRRGEKQTTVFHLPANYDPTQAYPLILGDLPKWFGDSDAFVVASLPADLPTSFHQSPDDHADFLAMLLSLRHSIHLDTQRTYLCAPANVGWLLLSSYPDIFSGAILYGPPLRLPYASQLYPILLGNFHHTPIRWVVPTEQNDTSSFLSLYIQDLVRRKNLPFEFIENNQTKHNLKAAKWLTSMQQPGASKPASHWYRFPSQGRTAWLSATNYKGSPWTADQLSIVVNPTINRDTYITGVLKNRLAYLEGVVLGQSIEIKTRRCGSVAWRLYENSIDWSKPITVICNGQKRFEGQISPSTKTMLEAARSMWDFSRPVWSSRTIAIRSDAPAS